MGANNFMSQIFYAFSSTTNDGCTLAKQFREEVGKTWLCTGCGNPRWQKAIDLIIQEDEPDNTPLNLAAGCIVGIARKDFLFCFGKNDVERHLYLGRLFREDGVLLEDWVTFHGRQRIVIRGSKDVSYRQCGDCGRHVYFAMGQQYLCPQPPKGINIFDVGSGELVLTKELAERVILNKWRKLACSKLPIFATPMDGLRENLEG